ncbi:DUF2986 domain-containing protein [Shewanella sp. HL-SH8]|jgi:hypothetical protein|uniref:DUF2986 domain-containing protein n=1 Tax=Shewanella TaxID=22 RepID=UPI001CF8A1B3|nr:DUF2986 domain-containing protein [Shewanella glacialimarina]UCX03128.1 DUF2986 domain-containing protein [Shewanella glacialimarina]
MNRKKKINQTLKAKAKKANQKLHTANKPQYVSKAERALLDQQSNLTNTDATLPITDSDITV